MVLYQEQCIGFLHVWESNTPPPSVEENDKRGASNWFRLRLVQYSPYARAVADGYAYLTLVNSRGVWPCGLTGLLKQALLCSLNIRGIPKAHLTQFGVSLKKLIIAVSDSPTTFLSKKITDIL
jgi:hypothetical protein